MRKHNLFVVTVRCFQKSEMKTHFLLNKVASCETGIHSEYFPDHFPKFYLSSEQGPSVSCWVLCSVVGTVLQGSSDREREVPLTAYLPLKPCWETHKSNSYTHTQPQTKMPCPVLCLTFKYQPVLLEVQEVDICRLLLSLILKSMIIKMSNRSLWSGVKMFFEYKLVIKRKFLKS